MVQSGEAQLLYDLDAQSRTQQQILSLYGFVFKDGVLPYYYPPFFVIPFLLLSWLPLSFAFSVWTLAKLALIFVSANSLLTYVGNPLTTDRIVVTLAVFSFLPLIVGLVLGQSTFLAFYLSVLTFTALKRGDDRRAGILVALGLFKPPLMVPALAILVYKRRWCALASFCVTSGILLFISAVLVGIKGLRGYIDLTVAVARWNDVYGICASCMHNWRGTVYRALLLGQRAWAELASHPSNPLPLLGSMAIVGLLFSPHLHTHDLTMWILVAFLVWHYYRNTSRLSQSAPTKALSIVLIGHAIPVFSAPLSLTVRAQLSVLFMALVAIVLERDAVNVVQKPGPKSEVTRLGAKGRETKVGVVG